MNRLIDTMTEVELSRRVLELYSGSPYNLKQDLEKLFAPAPHWSDNLAEDDKQTWVLCWLSDKSPDISENADWVINLDDRGYRSLRYNRWKYATPIDLDLRYNNGEDTL